MKLLDKVKSFLQNKKPVAVVGADVEEAGGDTSAVDVASFWESVKVGQKYDELAISAIEKLRGCAVQSVGHFMPDAISEVQKIVGHNFVYIVTDSSPKIRPGAFFELCIRGPSNSIDITQGVILKLLGENLRVLMVDHRSLQVVQGEISTRDTTKEITYTASLAIRDRGPAT